MRLRIAGAVMLFGLVAGPAAFAHRIDEYLQASLVSVGRGRVDVSMRLIPGVAVAPQVIAGIDADSDGAFSDAEEREYARRVLGDLAIAVDGKSVQPRLETWSVPQPGDLRDGLGEIHIAYSVELGPGGRDRRLTLEDRHLRESSVYLVNVVAPEDGETEIVAQKRDKLQAMYELDFEQTRVAGSRWSRLVTWGEGLQLGSLFHLGMRHIAEGTDHLLFLLVLLLPAPLMACRGRWGAAVGVKAGVMHVFGIVTAFTLGHSVTLLLAASGIVRVPGRPVEVLIAVSILVSAIHALRPIFPGREAYVAGSFGLIHGLAFAATLDRLGLAQWDRVAGILAFNAGIEAMQMMVVAAVLPSLLLMSGTRAYPAVRIAGAGLAGAAAVGWAVERTLNLNMPVDTAVNVIGSHGILVAGLLLMVSAACRLMLAGPVYSDSELGWDWMRRRRRSS